MESAFGRMFRKSKLASFNRGIKQIYATYPEAAARGEWGLKRPMPCKVTTRLATLKEIDSKEQITDFEAANQQFLLTMSWKENFPESRSPKYAATGDLMQDLASVYDMPSAYGASSFGDLENTRETEASKRGPQRNINTMTRVEWNDFLEEARSRRAEWKECLEKGQFAPEETMAFMNVTDKFDATNDGVHRSPTYHDYVPSSEELVVEGRVLNRVAAGYAVGVQGIVAYLPIPSHSMDDGFQYRDIKRFYVHSAKFDNQGRPVVVLGTKPRGTRGPTYSFGSRPTSTFSLSRSNTGKPGQTSAHRQGLVDRLKSIVEKNQELENRSLANKEAAMGSTKKPDGNADPVNDTLDLLDKTHRW
ncbi:hypothetical protein IW140_003132 [Coemansia sp. RSA 1813]|nr:hypothetical protein EV178_003037 [Coemansia sp. RSA 1646]KAJ1768615.1 hypothetical protein LPJ74_004724 [Coemansia sp. RSA 1843]KAJ2089484.1 hypothetical protein IW138_003373 [Coemansia sp. RSA 986]KAJ2214546.1 hypothetical protein EV179_002951 [Coemansia sp. RSA 487]KAJ2569429.1 hypothetical protein IW140_003132 [Coemansia sp. RSA 1813]